MVAFEAFRERAVERFNFNEDCEGERERQFEGVAEGEDDSEHVDELNDAARLCRLNDFESLEFSNESRVTYNVQANRLAPIFDVLIIQIIFKKE